MNALIRKFRVASTTGVAMSLAMASVLTLAPMSEAMAKSKKIAATSPSLYAAWADWRVKIDKYCAGKSYWTSNYKQTSNTISATVHCK